MTHGPIVIQIDPAPLDVRPVPERPSIIDEGAGVLFYGMLGPPLLTLLNLELSYALAPIACRAGSTIAMQISTAVILALVILAGVGAAMRLRRNWIEDTVLSRPGFMAILGILASTLFSAVIIAQWLPHAFLSACQ
ncbi:MAG TPA: hypothetical protein VGJ12_12455 [Gemmatimonadaceae bacterium]